MLYFTSDHHFGHQRIIELCNRPFQSVEGMDATMIERWNKIVKNASDTVYYLGDFTFHHRSAAEHILRQLNGRKVLIQGNHDTPGIVAMFDEVHNYLEIDTEVRPLVLFHYPIEEWNGFHKKWVHLHGHTHGRSPHIPGRLDVSVDTNGFYPYTFDEIWRRAYENPSSHPGAQLRGPSRAGSVGQ